MREQEVRDLYEAYMQVHQPQEEVEQLDEKAPKRITKDAENPRLMKDAGPARLHNPKKVDEETDLFDTILEYLVAEGYAETNEAALVIMTNMSEEWKQSIVEEVFDEALTGERYKKAVKKPGGTAYSRMVSADPSKRATRGGRGGESDFGAGDRGSGNRAARRAGTYKEA